QKCDRSHDRGGANESARWLHRSPIPRAVGVRSRESDASAELPTAAAYVQTAPNVACGARHEESQGERSANRHTIVTAQRRFAEKAQAEVDISGFTTGAAPNDRE